MQTVQERRAFTENDYAIDWHKIEREEAALQASQYRAHTARLLAQGKATIDDYRQARQDEDDAHRRA